MSAYNHELEAGTCGVACLEDHDVTVEIDLCATHRKWHAVDIERSLRQASETKAESLAADLEVLQVLHDNLGAMMDHYRELAKKEQDNEHNDR